MGLPDSCVRIASRTRAPTAGEWGRPRTITRLTSRGTSGSTRGRTATPGWVAHVEGMKPKPSPLAIIARIRSISSLR